MPNLIKQLFSTQIHTDGLQGASWDEINRLVSSQKLTEIALDDFLAQRITFDEYLELLNMHEVNVDSYLNNLEANFKEIKILT